MKQFTKGRGWILIFALISIALFFVFIFRIGLASGVLEIPSSDTEMSKIDYQATKTAQGIEAIGTLQAQFHDACLKFLTAPVTTGAVIDIDRLGQCREYLNDSEYRQILDHQLLRASGKLTVFLSKNPFYVVHDGQQKLAVTQSDLSYALVYDTFDGVTELQVGSCGETLPSVPKGTFLIYPCDN